MKTINLKKYYYPICKKDTFVEVPDEVADAIVEESRAEDANDAKQHYHCYSLDASPGMENHFLEQAVSPEDILMEKETEREQEAARALMMNTALVIGREEVRFSTIDVSLFDLYSGTCEFVKAGASTTFIKRKDAVEKICSDRKSVV